LACGGGEASASFFWARLRMIFFGASEAAPAGLSLDVSLMEGDGVLADLARVAFAGGFEEVMNMMKGVARAKEAVDGVESGP